MIFLMPLATIQVFGQQIVSLASGGTVTLTVTAEGTAPFSYEWRRDGAVLAGVASDRYVISSFHSTDAGAYSVVVSNSAGSTTTDAATLVCETASAPGFTSQPISQGTNVGATVEFTAVAAGFPSPTYRWRKDGHDLTNGGVVTGADTNTLRIAGISVADSGRYSVVATNSVGTALSADAILTVEAADSAPTFTVQPSSREVKEGSAVSFVAEAIGKPVPDYRWFKDGIALTDGGNVSGATTTKLNLSSVRSGDIGLYTLLATNSAGVASSSGAVLAVNSATSQKGGGKGSGKTSQTNGPATVLEGLYPYNDVIPEGFDVAGYLARYPKYKQKLGSDWLKAWLNYRDVGVFAGEVYDDLFRAEEYLALNPDVLATYGADLRASLLHWLNFGLSEGRKGRY